ncbi:MAG: EpsI family protein [Gammaproteobacteria bacterium]|nr:EpsI family protein [Gammaproteobacteria bacterium]
MSSRTERSMPQGETWRIAGVAIAALLLLTLILYQPTISYLMGLWNQMQTGNYAHGYLVLLISVYLIFYNRRKLVALTPCPEYRAILAVLSASMLWLVAALVDIEMLQTVGLLLLLLSMVWLLLGMQAFRVLAFPVLYISFAIPVWFPLSPVLQELTADAVFWVIRGLEIPALRIENMIVLPAGKLSIEEACGGLNYFLAAMTLSTLYAYLNYETLSSRLVVVLVSAFAAVLVNILRVFIVVYLGYTTDMQHPLIADHLSLGWYLFAGLVVVLLLMDAQLQKLRQHQLRRHQLQPHRSNGHQQLAKTTQTLCNKGKSQFVVIVLLAALPVSAGPVAVYWLDNQTQRGSYLTQPALMSIAGEWSAMDADEDDWTPQYRGAITHKITFNNKIGQQIHFYMGLYPTQKQGEELINDLNRISDDKIWYSGYQRETLYNIGGRQVLEQLLEKKDGSQRLVWYWYHVAGQNTVNKYQAKALQVLGLMKGMRQAFVVAIAAKLDGDPEYTREILAQFAEQMSSSIEKVTDGKD